MLIKEPSPSVIHQRASANCKGYWKIILRKLILKERYLMRPWMLLRLNSTWSSRICFMYRVNSSRLSKKPGLMGSLYSWLRFCLLPTVEKTDCRKCRFTRRPGYSIIGWLIRRTNPWNVLPGMMAYTPWWPPVWTKMSGTSEFCWVIN